MKLKITIFILFNFSILFSQNEWNFGYINQFTTSPRDISIDETGNVLVGGYHLGADRTNFLLNVNIENGDSLNNAICESGVFCDMRNDILHVATSNDGETFVAGNLSRGSTDYVAKLKNTESLDIEWIRDDLLAEKVHHIHELITISDGLIIIAVLSDFQHTLIKFDFNGNILWTKDLLVTPISAPIDESILMSLPDNSLVIWYKNGDRHFMSRITSDGQPIWEKQVNSGIVSLTVNNAGEIISVETEQDFLDPPFLIKKYSIEDGGVTTLNSDCQARGARKIKSNENGDLFVGGTYRDAATREDGLELIKLDSDGNFIWRETFLDPSYEDAFKDMAVSKSGQVVLLSTRSYPDVFTQRDLGLISVNGNKTSTSTNSIKQRIPTNIFPNPGSNQITVEFFDGFYESRYQVFDVHGQVIQKGNLIFQKQNIDISTFKSGVYFIRITNEDGQSYSQKLIKA